MQFRKAEKKKAKLRLAITGTAGSGKTYGALLIAKGLGGRIAMIDTENGSGDLYADLFDYDICNISAPYDVQKYIQAIHDAENAGYDIIIIDSLSHAWAGEGGLLDVQSKMAESQRGGNSYTAWRKVTPMQNQLIETILSSKCHIIATMRSKTDYIMSENERGRTEIKKVGLAPVQREGVEYEFSVVFDLSVNHTASVSKDRTSLFDGKVFALSEEIGFQLLKWLDKGVEDLRPLANEVWRKFLNFYGTQNEAMKAIQNNIGAKNSWDLTKEDLAKLEEFLQIQQQTQQEENNNAD